MRPSMKALLGASRAEFAQLRRSRLLIALTLIQAVTFIFLVSLFGMTGAFAPTAIVDYDQGVYAKRFIANLDKAHHSFRLYPMTAEKAYKEIEHGSLVAVIIIPPGFSNTIAHGKTALLTVVVDNIDTDMTADIQRALPSAITRFAKESQFPNIRIQAVEHNLIDHETDFIAYLIISALAIDAFIIAGILSGVAVAREFESGTSRLLAASPINPIFPIMGRVLATNIVSVFALAIAVVIAVFGFTIKVFHPIELLCILGASVILFGLIGATFGAAMRKTVPVSTLIFSLSLPLYLDSNTNEPQRFDGNLIWIIAHFTPMYQVVAILEHAVHNLVVTPETMLFNWFALGAWTVFIFFTAWYFIERNITR